jgi:hypothetical protein
MIDWPQVAANSIWIIGCAIIVAAFSHANWLAHVRAVRTRHLLGMHTFQLPFSIGFTLIALGLFFFSHGWLERGLWAVFAVLFTWKSWRLWLCHRRQN